jgi:peptidoglycan L-alanyl-D-glutamate endopeptidase CwlK
MAFFFGEKSRKELIGVHPSLVEICNLAIVLSPQDFGVHDGVRTAQEQRVLFERKASTKDGYKRKSKHQKQADGFGHAVDLVPFLPRLGYRWEWNLIFPIAAVVGRVAQEKGVNLVWGGVWDMPMNEYGKNWTAQEMENAVEGYVSRRRAAGRTAFIDGPHYELKS